MSESGSVGSFRGERILAWLDPEAYASGKGFQTLQALYAIGSGGILGKGLGQSMQKLGFLPEAQNDMIFSIICEELGLFGAIAVLMMFILLIWRCYDYCQQCTGSVWSTLSCRGDGAYCHSGYLKCGGSNKYHSQHRYYPFRLSATEVSSVMFLLAEIGIVFSVGRGIRLKDL